MRNVQERTLFPILVAAAVAGVAAGCSGSSKESAPGTSGGGSGGGGTNTARGTFTQVGSLATGRVGHTATLLPLSGKVVVIGGKGRSGSTDAVLSTAEIFDPATGRFTPARGTMIGGNQAGKNGRMSHAAVAIVMGQQEQVLVIGGQTDAAGQNQLATAEIYDATAQTFSAVTGSLSEPKADPVVIPYVSQGIMKVMVAGGRKSSNPQQATAPQVSLRTADIYRADSRSFSRSAFQLIQGRFGADIAPISQNQFVVVGGVNRDSATASPVAAGFEVFDASAEKFSQSSLQAPQSTNAKLNRDRVAADVAVMGSGSNARAAVFGGADNPNSPTSIVDTIEFYDESTNSWTVVTARLITPRSGHTATRLQNGDILIVGGRSSTGQVLATTEIVSGSGVNASVKAGPTLNVARTNHTATLLQNGQLLIAGGEDTTGAPIAAAEIFALPGSTVVGAGQHAVQPGGPGAPQGLTLNPSTGNIGTIVTIRNTSNNFAVANPSDNIVRFNGVVAPVQSATASELRVTVPNGATTGPVSVQIGQDISQNNPIFTVGGSTNPGGGGGGSGFSGPPRIFIVLPSSGPAFMPVGIGGSNFDVGTIPYFNSVPSISLFNWSTQNLPLIGSVSIGFTIVPLAAPPGNGFVQVQYFGQLSNPFPFTVQ